MSDGRPPFQPEPPLVSGSAAPSCRACVTLPARNEAESLPQCLDALLGQVDLHGSPLPFHSFEVLLFANNCTDHSAQVVRAWHRAHPELNLHLIERCLPGDQAHVGTARRLLMDTAWARLRHCDALPAAILSSDADTVVVPDWIAQNLHALEAGADVVAGEIGLLPGHLAALPPPVLRCYRRDRHYSRLIARLEDLLDPQPGDPWPRHLDHFGSSLVCTPHAYAKAGGMPAVSPLEDEAFIDRVRRACLMLRHEPSVRVYTSARFDGRAAMGMAGQLRLWSKLHHEGAHRVPSAEFLDYRFRFMRRLRQVFLTRKLDGLNLPTEWWANTFAEALSRESTCPGFLGAIYCDILIAESFEGPREEPILDALAGLRRCVRRALSERPDDCMVAPRTPVHAPRPEQGTIAREHFVHGEPPSLNAGPPG